MIIHFFAGGTGGTGGPSIGQGTGGAGGPGKGPTQNYSANKLYVGKVSCFLFVIC
jgi:hypothetical protein